MARLPAILGFLIVALCVLTHGAQAQSSVEQGAVKAAFLSRFPSFVQWPAGAFSDDLAAIRLCTIGDGPFAALLDRSVAGQTFNGRPFDVRRLSTSAEARDCHIVYMTGVVADETLRALRGLPILSVTDAASGGSRGIIHFAIVQDHVRFYVDDAQAAESGLFISSRLLALAVAVRRRE